MAESSRELLVTAFSGKDFGVVVGCGLRGGLTEIIDDVAFAPAPIDVDGATDRLGRLRPRATAAYLTFCNGRLTAQECYAQLIVNKVVPQAG